MSVDNKSENMAPPLGLNTVALLEAGSKAMGMSPKQVMNVAEKLYSAGFISYPRTETTRYHASFDVRYVLTEHRSHPLWSRTASYLLKTKYNSKSNNQPPFRGKDIGDHPPITPLKAVTRQDVDSGAAWKVYEFVVRNFLGSLHNKLSFTRTVSSLQLGHDYSFQKEIVTVDFLGFADCCPWILNDIGASGQKDNDTVHLRKGLKLPISNVSMYEAQTKPPPFLQEHELILLMDQNRIGTDASMAVHVSNIIDRGYVMLCDQTGDPLRQPRPFRPGQKPLPRQIGRYLVPTSLGLSLFDLFDQNHFNNGDLSPALLSKPSIRRQMEEEVKQIALGTLDKDFCLQKNLQWFQERYQELDTSLSRQRINQFGHSLCPTSNSLRYWRRLNVFEPKELHSNNKLLRNAKSTKKRHKKQIKRASTFNHSTGRISSKRKKYNKN